MSVLVLSEDFDPTVDRVIDILHSRNVPVFRADTAWFPQKLSLDAELADGGWDGVLATDQRELGLVGVRSIWYRRPTAFEMHDELSEPERQHASWEAKFGVGGVLASLDALWMNHPASESDVSYKPRQLAVAQRCGLAVPRSLVTNRPKAVERFRRSVEGQLIIKPLSVGYIAEESQLKPIYTHLLSDDDLDDLTGVEATAHLFQEFVPKAAEARVVVVGSKLFSARIIAGSHDAYVDWRSDYDALTYEVIKVPEPVTASILSFMRTFGLEFAAFDFVLTPDDAWIFLEANAGGQFGWIEAHTSLPISEAVADLLQKGNS